MKKYSEAAFNNLAVISPKLHRTNGAWIRPLIPVLTAFIMAGCGLTVLPSSITIEGQLTGTDGTGTPVPATVLTVARDSVGTSPRIEYRASGGLQRLQGVGISVVQSTGLPEAEEFFILSMSRLGFPPGSNISPLNEITGAQGWMRGHLGDMVVLPLRKDDVSLPSNSFTEFQPSQLRPAGAVWLARIEDNAPVIPWRISVTDANCSIVPMAQSMIAPPPGQTQDCFDFETLSSMFLTTLAVGVTEAVANVDIPASTVSASNHQLHIIPHLRSNVGDPGFGFVYSVNITVSAVGLPVAGATVHVPISMHFRSDGGLIVDPMTGLNDPANPARVTVTYGDGPLDGVVANMIHTQIIEALGEIMLPPVTFGTVTLPDGTIVPLSTSAENAFELLINQVSGRSSTADANFAVIALPEQSATINGTITNIALSIPAITRTVAMPIPGIVAGATADGTGTVRVVQVSESAVIIFMVPRPTVENGYRLAFLQ